MERTKRPYHRKSNSAKRLDSLTKVPRKKVPAIAEPIQCPHCPKTLSRIDNYMVHLRIHTGEMPYACQHCSKTFRHPTTRNRHQLVCDNRDEGDTATGTGTGSGSGTDTDADNETAINFNNKTSSHKNQGYHKSRNESALKKTNGTQSKSVLRSQNSNEVVASVQSPSPSPSTSSSAAGKIQKQIPPSDHDHLTSLLLEKSKSKQKLPFPCKYCTEKFSDYFQLLFHERQYHLFNVRPFSCRGCTRRFPRKSELDSHRKIHRRRIVIVGVRSDSGVVSGSGSFPPSPIAQPPTSASNKITVEHNKTAEIQQTSTGTGTGTGAGTGTGSGSGSGVGFSCPICKFVCKSKQSQRLHLLVHTGEKTHFCRFCPKSFLRKGELRVHELRMHLNYKPHKCLRCGKQYTLQTTLRAHQLNSCNPAKAKRAKVLLQKKLAGKIAQKNKTDPNLNLNPMSDSDLDLDTDTDQGQSRIKSVHSSRTSSVSKSKSTFQFQSRLNNISRKSDQNSSNTKKHVYCQFCNKKYTGHNYLRKHMITSRKCAALKGKAKSKVQPNLSSSGSSSSIAKDKESGNSDVDSNGSDSDTSTVSKSKKSKNPKSKVSKTSLSKSKSKLASKTSSSSSTRTETRQKSVSGQKNGNSSKGPPGILREGMSAKRLQQFKKRATSDPNLVGVKIGGAYYFKCAVCSKTFRPGVHKHAVEHTWTHTGYKPHRCPKCNLGFLRVNAYKEHMAKCKLRKNIHQGANTKNQRRKGDASSGSGSD